MTSKSLTVNNKYFFFNTAPGDFLTIMINNPIFDAIAVWKHDHLLNLSPFIKKALDTLFGSNFRDKLEIIREVDDIPEDDIIELAEQVLNVCPISGRERNINSWLTLSDMIHAPTHGVSDEVGPVDLVQFFANAATVSLLDPNVCSEYSRIYFRNAYIVLRALHVFHCTGCYAVA